VALGEIGSSGQSRPWYSNTYFICEQQAGLTDNDQGTQMERVSKLLHLSVKSMVGLTSRISPASDSVEHWSAGC
jgi:hypothetical protein